MLSPFSVWSGVLLALSGDSDPLGGNLGREGLQVHGFDRGTTGSGLESGATCRDTVLHDLESGFNEISGNIRVFRDSGGETGNAHVLEFLADSVHTVGNESLVVLDGLGDTLGLDGGVKAWLDSNGLGGGLGGLLDGGLLRVSHLCSLSPSTISCGESDPLPPRRDSGPAWNRVGVACSGKEGEDMKVSTSVRRGFPVVSGMRLRLWCLHASDLGYIPGRQWIRIGGSGGCCWRRYIRVFAWLWCPWPFGLIPRIHPEYIGLVILS